MSAIFATLMSLFLLSGPGSPWPDLTADTRSAGGGEHDAAVVVGIEDYTYLPDVPGATRNSLEWYQYLTKVRGVKTTRVFFLENTDATASKITRAVKDATAKVGHQGTLWFVFVGHGAPSADGADGVLVAVDAHPDEMDFYPRTLRRSDLLEALGTARASARVAVLDACFSGLDSGGRQLVEGRQFSVPAAMNNVGSVTVMTAGRPKDFAGPLPGARRPAFSYLALGALMGWGDGDGDQQITASEVVKYAREVLRTLDHGRHQQPSLSGEDRSLAKQLRDGPPAPDLAALNVHLRGSGPFGHIVSSPAPTIGDGGPVIDSGTATIGVADVAILAEPKNLVRLEVAPPKGKKAVSGSPYKNHSGEPGIWKVKAQAAGYEDYEATFHAPVDDVTVHRIEMKELGGLDVDGTPVGASVKVTGPAGFSHAGALIWKASGLRSGLYQVMVARKGYLTHQETVEVQPGRNTKVSVSLKRENHDLEQGAEPAEISTVSPNRLRSKTEWFALRINGGTYGIGAAVSLFTVRWRWFFWEILRGCGGAGPLGLRPVGNANIGDWWWATGGMMWGVPWFLDRSARHELRFGVGLAGGFMVDGRDGEQLSAGPFITPELVYIWHEREYFALQAGMNLVIATTVFDSGSLPEPVLNFFFGIRI